MSDAIIEVKNLKKYFQVKNGLLHAVDDVNFIIPKGTTMGLVGESGCGKSTIGRLILRLTEATEGEILFEGQDIRKLNKKDMRQMRQKIQMVFQDPYASLDGRKSVFESIAEPLIVQKVYTQKSDLEKRVYELMETAGLAKRLVNSYPHELDGGRRQRVGIARALALNPDFIVLDEPVSALDVSIQAQVLNLMEELQQRFGLTYLFISHDLSVVKHISDQIAVMYLGQIVETAQQQGIICPTTSPIYPGTFKRSTDSIHRLSAGKDCVGGRCAKSDQSWKRMPVCRKMPLLPGKMPSGSAGSERSGKWTYGCLSFYWEVIKR